LPDPRGAPHMNQGLRGRLRKRKIKHAKPLLTQMFDCSWHFHHGNCNCPT
jgi:hypothetical protein